jgi:hypothetical protein
MLAPREIVEPVAELPTTEYAVLGLFTSGEAWGYDLARGSRRSCGRLVLALKRA